MDSNIGEIICEAVDTIVSKRLEGLNYNTTQTCIIVNDLYKQIGRYTVKGDNLTFEAYSTNTTFKKDDKVLVMIPNGDYNEQKIILNKISSDDDLTSSVAYTSPLKKMLKFSNNIIKNDIKILNDNTTNGSISLLANGENNVGYLNPEKLTYKLMYSIDFSGYNNYSKLGISADFQSWLKDLGVVSGDYGLEFLFFDNNTSLIDRQEHNSTYRFTFGVNDILGNPYDFQTYFTQEKVIDITHLKNLKTLEIYFYQNGNFKSEDGEYIINSVNGSKLSNNLFVKNLELYIGYDINEYSGDTITINTTDILNFSRLRDNDIKTINLYWIRKINDSDYQIIDSSNVSNNSGQALTHDGTDINLIDAEIYWVRQDAIESDLNNMDIVGANWIYKESEITINDVNKFMCTLNINSINNLIIRDTIRIKAVLRIKDANNNWKIYESNILTFTSEDVLADQTTIDALTGLSIQCDDGGYSGIYFIYGSNNKIIDESKGSGDQKQLVLYYNGKEIGSNDASIDLNDIINISWTVWKNTSDDVSQSMINFPDIETSVNEEGKEIAGQRVYSTKSSRLKYTISDIWYPSITQNNITCSVQLRDGTEYKASKEFLFGKANSQGSNYNLVIQYEQFNQNAYELVTKDKDNTIMEPPGQTTLVARLYDINGAASNTIQNENIEWQWSLMTGSKDDENNNLNNNNIFRIVSTNGNKCTITAYSDINLTSNFTILKVVCTISGSKIIAYKPIAIKTKVSNELSRCDTISGDPIITYNTLGKPIYNSSTYQLANSNGKIDELEWNLYATGDQKGIPTLKSTENGKALSASSVYIKDNAYQICVVAEDKEGTIYWSQPIFVTQSNYDLAIVNDWDESMNAGEVTVKTSAVAAGKMKNSGFSGIILGDVDVDNDSATEDDIGLYGISDGIVTFSLTSNGLATFQKDTSQILLGNDNQILCCDSLSTHGKNEDKCGNLLLIDLDDRFFTLSSIGDDKQGIYMSPFGTSTKPYLTLGDNNKNNLLTFTNEDFYLQSDNYSADNQTGLRFDVKKGIINLQNGDTIGGNSNRFSIGKLQVNNDGEVYYNNELLTDYIKNLITEIVEN